MWKDLTMEQRAEVIKMAIQGGLRNLTDIRSFYDNSLKREDGGSLNSLPENWTLVDENNYNEWRNSLPDNLRNTGNEYDMRRAFKAGMQPTLEKDGEYHLGSRDPKTGRILKAPYHPTYLMAIATDARMGYYPKTDSNGVTTTDTWKGRQFAKGGNKPITTGGAGYVPNGYVSPTKHRQVYKSLTGKVFSTREEAIKDNTDAKYGRGVYAPKDITHSVIKGDTLWGIANANNTDVSTLRRLNPNIKGDLIRIGDKIRIGQSTIPTLHDIRKEWKKEKVLNTDNIKAIQGVKHKDNYVIIDKLNNSLTVYDRNNKELYRTSDISTGKSGNDYNTITYVDKNGKIRSGAGNESTPAGITKITGTGIYHGFPSYTRGRQQGDLYEDIASSLHFGGTKDKKASNGCVRIGGQSLQELSAFIGKGTDVYTLPEKAGSRFKVKDGKLNFVADNPYGKQEGDKKYWDDYNTYTDKSYSPLTIVDKKKSDNATYNKNRRAYADAIVNSKERLQKKFNIDSDTYNRIASLALGIAEQETKYGTANSYIGKQATRDILGDTMTDTVINPLGRAVRQLKQGSLPHNLNQKSSRGLTQIKLSGDNRDTQEIYKQLGITEDSIDSPENSAVATVARLAQMYNTEVLGRNFTGVNGIIIDPYDALLYKWMGRNSELSNHTATPELNNYINNVKKYQNDFGLYTMRYGNGGSIHIAPSKRGTFTAAASKEGMGVQEFASKVLANKEDYSSAMVKKANFARSTSKWKH